MANKNFIVKRGLEVTGNITATGTVGGRDLNSDGSKLDGIEVGATAGGGLPSGTKTNFFQASAPTGWTQDTTNNDATLRIVNGAGGGTGGSAALSNPTHSLSAGSHTLSEAEMPSHVHNSGSSGWMYHWESGGKTPGKVGHGSVGAWDTQATGGGGAHSHSLAGSITTLKYIDVIICSKD